jgi:Tol biopolymer transport system component
VIAAFRGIHPDMSLSAGTKLGPYEITGHIGSGGMGEVYRAMDSKLGREVAIKTLPAALASDQDRLARFEREAKLLATLNHPHIASVYSLDEHDGTLYLAMELVEGTTLEEMLKPGALSIEDALRIALQIAQALEAAHDKGVIHRDLKPGNIMVTADGQVKVLDFGLAKAFATDTEEASPGRSPALSLAMTQQGIILGTAGYMSPEQASGQATDQRADIWAFGVVVYEMLTGLPLFSGESVPHILASVLKTDPDWGRLPERMHPRLRQMLERCLAKKPRVRYHAIADARVDIEEALGDPAGLTVERGLQAPPQSQALVLSVAFALMLGALAAGTTVWLLKSGPAASAADMIRLQRALPPGEEFTHGGGAMTPLALSPDGRTVVYAVGGQIWKHEFASGQSTPIAGTEAGAAPFYSPDGQSIGFFAQSQLKKIAIDGGGASETLCDAPNGVGGSWGADDTIYFAPFNTSGIWKVTADGDDCEPVTTVKRADGEISHRWPQALPEGKGVLFTRWNGPGDDETYIDAHLFADSSRKVLAEGATTGRWTSSGHLVYSRAGVLTATRFDLATLQTSGSAVSLDIGVMDMEGSAYALSNAGHLAYIAEDRAERVLVWVDRQGNRELITEVEPRRYESAVVSPDGRKVAVTISGSTWDIWTFQFGRPGLTLLAPSAGSSSQWPLWTEDSNDVIYRGTRNGFRDLYRFAVDGSDSAETRLTESENMKSTAQVSNDGQWLVYEEIDPESGTDLWRLALDGESDPEPLVVTDYTEANGRISPDGNWLAYNSNRSGQNEVYLRPFPGPGGRSTVSGIEGGFDPHWSTAGDELFYLSGNRMMSVSVATEPDLDIGTPEVLFEGVYDPLAFDVGADDRFLRIQPVESQEPAAQFEVVINWFEELKRQVPVD